MIPKGREQYLRDVRRQPELSDKKKAYPVRWLISYLEYAKQPSRNWSKSQIRNCLPLVWKTEKTQAMVQEWMSTLRHKVVQSNLKMEQAFLKKFGRNRLQDFRREVLEEPQPMGESCVEWFSKIWNWRTYLQRWNRRSVPGDYIFFKNLQHRFTCKNMVSLLSQHSVSSDESDSSDSEESGSDGGSYRGKKEYMSLCRKADRMTLMEKEREKRTGGSGIALYNPRYGREVPEVDRVSFDEIVRSVAFESKFEVSDSERDFDGTLEGYYAELDLFENNIPVSVRMVSRIVAKGNLSGRFFAQIRESEIKNWQDKMGRRHDDSDNSQVCPFHSTKLSGCSKGAQCSWQHIDRKNQWCPLGKNDTRACPKGAWCPFRHKGDVYCIWFRARSGNGYYRGYEWKDLRSPFSIHSNKARAEAS